METTVSQPEDKFDFINCSHCNQSITAFSNSSHLSLFTHHLREGSAEISCKNGHKTIICLQSFHFEIHFEIGALALIDGYFAESTFAFSKALERFYEFSINFFTLRSSTQDEFEKSWKIIKKQSERQLGAFIFLYLQNFKESPTILQDLKLNTSFSCGEFRNKVIHDGYLPTKIEAYAYGKFIFEFISKLIVKYKELDQGIIQRLTGLNLQKLTSKNKKLNPTYMYGGLILSTAREDLANITLENEIESLQKRQAKRCNIQSFS